METSERTPAPPIAAALRGAPEAEATATGEGAGEPLRFEGGPAILADFMLAAVLHPEGGLVSLDPDGDAALVSLRRGNATLAQLSTTGDVAVGAIGRLARMTDLDPLAEVGSITETRAARLAIRLGRDTGQVLVTLGATSLGMSAELRLLSFRGNPLQRRAFRQLTRCATCGAYQPPLRQRCEVDGGPLRELSDDPIPGGTIGVYRIHERLGEGAMGEVFAAEHALIGRSVAIKVLRARLASDPAIEARFLFEARATSRLRHPNLIEVTDYGVLPSGSPFIVMERLDGESLERRMGGDRALEPAAALRIARAIAIGLSAAHDGGVVHNDLKPSNVILLRGSTDEVPRLKIIDFGAASVAGADDDGMLVGTAAYMAPERIGGEPSDVRSDTYSLGVLLYRMLSGVLPFDADGSLAMFAAHVSQAPEPLTSPYGVMPSRVVRVVTRALAKEPAERFQSMKQMIVELDIALDALAAPGWRRWLP